MVIFGKNQVSRFTSEEKRAEFIKAYEEALENYPKPSRILDVKTMFGLVRVYEYLPKEQKDTTPMVFFHGHYASSLMWQPNLIPFIDEVPIYLLDFLDEPGLSRQRKAFKNNAEQASCLESVFKKLKLAKFHLVGVSLGGWKAVNYAFFYPKRVRSLILLDPVSVFTRLSKEIVFRYLGSLFKEYDMVKYLLNGDKLPPDNSFAKTINIAMSDFYFGTAFPLGTRKTALKSLTCPVLAIMAGKSPLHDANQAVRSGRKWVKNIEIENWKDATHGFSFELADEVNEKMRLFIKRIEEN